MNAAQPHPGPTPRERGLVFRKSVDRLIAPALGVALLVRVLTDDRSPHYSRHTGSFNLSGAIAAILIVVAAGILLQRRSGMRAAALAALWLSVWTVVAIHTNGASTETVREGVREASVFALALIVWNAPRAIGITTATRLVQLLGVLPALLALYQLATGTGVSVAGQTRANGTLAHPNSAAMLFAIVATVSLWRYLDCGRRRGDGLLVLLFVAATISTYSIDGVIALVSMFAALGVLRPGPLQVKRVPFLLGGLVVVVFFATPLGAQRISQESATSVAAVEKGSGDTSLAWRIHKWEQLLPEWEGSPVLGRGLGTTLTEEAVFDDAYRGVPPHNEYVRYLVETGVLGLLALTLALGLLVRRLLGARRTWATAVAGMRNAPMLALAVIFGCLVDSLADNTAIDTPTCYLTALLVAAVLASLRLSVEPSQAPSAA